MASTAEKDKIELKQRLARVLRVPCNKTCADCPETRPTWISFIKPQQQFALGSKVLASFVCLECAGHHRKLGTHICVVRSISHDQFEEKDVECAEYSGNEVVNEIFEGHLQKSTMDGVNIKPALGADVSRRERFIRQKYVDLYFYRKRAHYQHISEVNKLKPLKSLGSKSSPTQPFRKKLKMFLHEDNSVNDTTLACSTTVTNTSRTRTITDRDDSNRSETPIRIHRNENTKRITRKPTNKPSSSKGSKSKGRKAPSRKKSQKKSSSQRRLKLEDPMFGMPFHEGMQKQPSLRNLKEPAHIENNNINNHHQQRKEREREMKDLSGMILVFDEDSFDSVDSPEQQRRSSRDLARHRQSGTTSVPNKKKPTINTNKIQQSAPNRKRPTIDSHQMQHGFLDDFNRRPPIKTSSEVCDIKDPLTTTLVVRRNRSEITLDEITRKREGSLSPGHQGKKPVNAPLRNSMSTTTPLIAHLSKDPSRIQNTSSRNLKIPYLEPSPLSPTSVEGFISEETSYGFGDHTVNNMSGTGEDNEQSHAEDSTLNGFRVIQPESVSEVSDSDKPDSKGSFSRKFKNKREIDGLIKSQSKRSLTRDGEFDAGLDPSDEFNEINKSNRSIFEKAFMCISNKSSMSADINTSSRSFINRSNMSVVSVEEPTTKKQLRQIKKEKHIDCDTPVSKKMKKKSSRSLSNKSSTSLSVDEPPKRKKGRRPKSQQQIDCETPVSTKKKKSSRSLSNKSNMSLSVDEPVKRKKARRPKSKQQIDCETPVSTKKKKKKKSSRSLSNKSNMSLSVDETAKRKKVRRPKSQDKIDCDTPQSKKKKSSKKRIKRKEENSRSKSAKKDRDLKLRNKALLDEWERLKNENQREFEKLRTENQRRFADFDKHFSQHIKL